MTINLGINGFGRIGRSTLSHITESARNDVQVTKINATGSIQTNAHLLKYDSTHGRFAGKVTVGAVLILLNVLIPTASAALKLFPISTMLLNSKVW